MRRAKTKGSRKNFATQKMILYCKTLPPQEMKIIILKPPWRDSAFVFKVKIALKVTMRRAKQKPEEKL